VNSAIEAIQGLNFTLAAALLADAELNSPTADVAFQTGQLHLSLGRLNDALAAFHSAWERARTPVHALLRSKICFRLEFLYSRTGNPTSARQFRQLGLAAWGESLQSQFYTLQLPEVTVSNALAMLDDGDQTACVSSLEKCFSITGDLWLRGRIAQILSELLPEEAIFWLAESSQAFQRAGDLSGAIQANDTLARIALASGDWEGGLRSLRLAREFVETIGLKEESHRYRLWISRLWRATQLHRSVAVMN